MRREGALAVRVEARRRVGRDHVGQGAAVFRALLLRRRRHRRGEDNRQSGSATRISAYPSLPPVPLTRPRRFRLVRALPAMRRGEPDRPEVLVHVMARPDLPAMDVGAQRHDPVPPIACECSAPLRRARACRTRGQSALLRDIGLVQHLVVELVRLRILVIAVILAADRMRQPGLDIDQRVDDAVAIAAGVDGKSPLRSDSNQGPVGTTCCVTLSPILLH